MSMQANISGELGHYERDCLGAVLIDSRSTIRDVSDGMLSLSAFDRGYLVGRSVFDIVHPHDIERATLALQEAALHEVGTRRAGMCRLRFSNGDFHHFAVSATIAGERSGTVLQFDPVSPQLHAEEFAADTVNTLRMLAEPHQLTDCLERVHLLAERHLPGADLHVATIEAPTVVHHVWREQDRFERREAHLPELPEHIDRALARHCDGPPQTFRRMAEFDTHLGTGRVTSVLTGEDHELLGYFVATRAAEQEPTNHEWMVYGLIRQVLTMALRRVRLEAQLQHVADSDPLTGLVNRRRLFRDMDEAETLEGTALMLIDLDRFSWFNNTLGHQAGDAALIALADQLVDMAPPDATVGRFGGDEFIVWLPGGIQEARVLAEKVHVTPVRPSGVDDLRATVRSSIGAIIFRPGETVAEAIGRADLAMYVVKDLGGDDSHFA